MKQEENRPMDKLKSDYESIPVPTEAKERMLAGIAQAKKEQKGVIIMKFAKKNRRGRCRCHDCHYRAGQRHSGPCQCHGTDSGHWIHCKGGNLPHL